MSIFQMALQTVNEDVAALRFAQCPLLDAASRQSNNDRAQIGQSLFHAAPKAGAVAALLCCMLLL